MKKIHFALSVMVIAMSVMVCNPAMAQTRKQKKAAQQAEWEFQQKKREMERQRVLDSIENANKRPAESALGSFVDVPCYDQSRSDKEYYRELGTGKAIDLASARRMALQSAQALMRDRLAHQVKGLATDYSKTMSNSKKGAEMEQIIEGEFTNIVDGFLNDADNPCEKWSQDRTGNFNAFYTIEIRKGDLVDKLAEGLSKNEKLQAEFDRDQFRKYAEEYMKKQQDFQNGQQ